MVCSQFPLNFPPNLPHSNGSGPYTMHYRISPCNNLLAAGPFPAYPDIYMMRLYCYDSYSDDPYTVDQLGFCSHSYYAQPLGIRFYIREDRLSLALLADSLLVARPKLDLVI